MVMLGLLCVLWAIHEFPQSLEIGHRWIIVLFAHQAISIDDPEGTPRNICCGVLYFLEVC